MSEGNLAQWKKQEGDAVAPGDVLAEVETDKATVDFESVEEGFLAKILVPSGSNNVPVGKLVAIMVEEKSDISAFAAYKDEGSSAPFPPKKPETPTAAPTAAPVAIAATPVASAPVSAGGRVSASPLAKATAREAGLDLNQVVGTGPGGRIIAADVREFKPATAAMVAAVAGEAGTGSWIDIPNSSVRKVIAKRLLESKQSIPHYYLTIDIIADNLLKMRSEFNAKLEGEVKLSVNDFIIKAAACALKKNPVVNSSWSDNAVRQYNYVDISVAVSTDNGLITPIVFDADRKGLVEISKDVKDLASKARSNSLKPEQFIGGTFTISNLGMFGVDQFCAIINPPQAAILAVGAASKKLIPLDDIEKPFKVSNVFSVTLSCDHRVIDGAIGAQWLKSFKEFCESPNSMLM